MKYVGALFQSSSPAFNAAVQLAQTVARSDEPVLLMGESGVGKEQFVRLILDKSPRKDGPCMSLSCTDFNQGTVEGELFGHERGAFTGAMAARKGLIEAAHQGTLFLDEIGDMPLPLQAKLLRVLQEHEVRRAGSNSTRKVDFRLICATNCDLEKALQDQRFRLDLYYRINVFTIPIPSLRDRAEDIPALFSYFAKRCHYDTKLTKSAINFLQSYSWPGNVRELENLVKRLSVVYGSTKYLSREIIMLSLPSRVTKAPVRLQISQDKDIDGITSFFDRAEKGFAAKQTVAEIGNDVFSHLKNADSRRVRVSQFLKSKAVSSAFFSLEDRDSRYPYLNSWYRLHF